MSEHNVTYHNFETDGGTRGGVVAKCSCGWFDRWWTSDGSAQQSGSEHKAAAEGVLNDHQN